MRAVVQRVAEASVEVGGEDVGRIGQGLLALVGVARDDGAADAEYIAGKVVDLRVFEDADGRMNRSVRDVGGAVLLVSQFTLCGDARKGRRPSWDGAAPPETARTFYEDLARRLRDAGLRVETGRFQASMRVHLINDGPVTVLLDSRRTF
jgi:D-tyrosyl-tRNA(Tyr) deacylase